MGSDFKSLMYSKYHSLHTKKLYGNYSMGDIKRHFIFWNYYFSSFLPKDKTVAILDAGCGNGGFVHWLQELGYLNSIGIDISEEMIDISKSFEIKNIYQEDIFTHLRDHKNKYDIIFCRDVLEHLNKSEVVEMFSLFYQSLRSKGKVIIQVPNGYSPNYGKIFYSDFTHETIFSLPILNQLAHFTGFKFLFLKEINPVPHGFFSSVRFLLWNILKIYYKIVQLIENGNSKGIFSQNIIASMDK